MNFKPFSATVLGLAGLTLAGMGLYFIFIRPALLPEDLAYMGSTLKNVKENFPGLLHWLEKVFWVLGGYIFTTGLLIIFISFTSFRKRLHGTFIIATTACICSIGLMTIVNFMIQSEFKWVILTFTTLWLLSLILYRLNK